MSTIDLDKPPEGHNYKVTVERDETAGERYVRLFKDVALFGAALVLTMAVVTLCFVTVLSATASADEQKWAMSVLSLATGGLIGYLVRK